MTQCSECPRVPPVTHTSRAHDHNHTVCPEEGTQLLFSGASRELCLLGLSSEATALFGDLPGPVLTSPFPAAAPALV